ncbi:MAG: DUF1489 domain-containing protein [Rhodospirillaceae bacterium]|nr:DUF1489 domain-containing protein [Rhodospirillaceae bacterium]MBL6941696.1 DUF1489 domain-containing protein [Rhodospirillales bacterium]
MTLHILKLSVGVEDVDHLAQIQKARLKREGVLAHITRNTPRKADEILDGGSIYWVIKRFIRVRQRLVGIERGVNSEGKPSCALVLDPTLVTTELKEFRAFQGWRYFKEEDAPVDLIKRTRAAEIQKTLPDEMAAELRSLGLI